MSGRMVTCIDAVAEENEGQPRKKINAERHIRRVVVARESEKEHVSSSTGECGSGSTCSVGTSCGS
jgi:hypothetical protein